MKQGWEIKKLGEVLQKTETVDPTKKPNLTFKYVDVSSVSNTTYSIDNYVEIYGKDAPSRARKLIKCGDVLFATVRPSLKRIAIVPNALNGDVCSTGYFVLRPKKECYNRFIYFYLQSYQFIDYIKTKEKGASYPAVTDGDVKSVGLMIPPITEQERIVGILDSAFAKIEALRANAQQNLQNTKDLFQASLKQELTLKQGWKTQKLDAIADITSSKRIYKDEYVKDGVSFYRTKEIKELANGQNISLELFISTERYQEIKNKFGVPQIGDILISAVGTIGEILVIQDESEFYFKDGNIIWIKGISKTTSLFLSYNLKSIVEQLKSITIGAAYSALTIEKFKEMKISFPDSKIEQQVIVEKLNALNERCIAMEENYRQTIAHCNDLKQALLTKAFNGEL